MPKKKTPFLIYRYMYVMEYQVKLILEFFCRNSPSRTFLLLSGGNPGTKTVANNKLPVPSSCGQTERWEVALVRRLHILIVQVYHIVLSDIVAIQRRRKKNTL